MAVAFRLAGRLPRLLAARRLTVACFLSEIAHARPILIARHRQSR